MAAGRVFDQSWLLSDGMRRRVDFQGEWHHGNLSSAACHAAGWGFGAGARGKGNQTSCNAHAVMPRCRSNVTRIQRKARLQPASRHNTATDDSRSNEDDSSRGPLTEL